MENGYGGTCGIQLQMDVNGYDGVDDKRQLREQYLALQMALTELGLQPVIDRTGSPIRHVADDVTIAILAERGEALSLLLEGNLQNPGSALLVLSPSWLSRQLSSSDLTMETLHGHKAVTMETLYLHKAVTADAGGQTFLDVFAPPRRVTYVISHMTGSSDHVAETEAMKLTKFGLDTPMSSSALLSQRLENQLLMRSTCAAVGVAHPSTLGFWLAGESSPDYPDTFPTVRVVTLATRYLKAAELEPCVRQFLGSSQMRNCEKVIVKTFGQANTSTRGVHASGDVTSIVTSVMELLLEIEPGSGILVESMVTTFNPEVPDGIGRHAVDIEGVPVECQVKAIVSRTPQDGARLSEVVCGISARDSPKSSGKTVPISLEMLLKKWGIFDVTQQKGIRDVIKRSSEKLMVELMEKEKGLTAEERGGVGAQTDVIGIDYVITKIDDIITPVVTSVSGQACIRDSYVHELINPENRGQASRTWAQTMVARSQRFLMKDKTVLVVGAGGFSKRNLWKDACELGVKIVLVESDSRHFARGHVHVFLHHDINDHTRDYDHADVIIRRVQSEVGHVDGCLAISEDFVPLASLVAEGLKLDHTPPFASAQSAKQKGLTMKRLNENGSRTSQALSPALFASPIARITQLEDVDEAAKQVSFPAVLKLEFGSGGFGVKHVRNVEEARDFVQYVQNNLRSEEDHPGVGLGHGQSFVLMPRLMGTEHNVDVVMFDGHLMAAFVTDHGPTHVPLCQQTAAALPTILCPEAERELVAGVAACCRGLGLTTGVFNVEMMMTPRGPRLIEINARMGGFYLRDWIRRVYHVDIFHMAIMAACGVRPVATNSLVRGHSSRRVLEHSGQLLGIMVYPSRHGHALATTATPEHLCQLHEQGVIVLTQIEPHVQKGSCEYEEPFANLAVHAPTLEEARAKLVGVCLALGLETEDTLNYILQDFIHL
nr:hypothetical protein BaRGS_032971 [Batillaria attramentaria]